MMTGNGVENIGNSEPMFNHNSAASGLSVDDENPGLDQGHSLPNVDELKMDHGAKASEFIADDGEIQRKQGGWIVWLALFLAIIVIGVIVGIAVAVTSSQNTAKAAAMQGRFPTQAPIDQRPTDTGKVTMNNLPPPTYTPAVATSPPATPAPDTASPEERTEQIKDYLIEQGISSQSDLNQSGSAQQQALNFLAVEDEMKMPVPAGGKSTLEGYEFMTRYVLSTLYYETFGVRWTFDLNFMKSTGVCTWYSVLQYVDLSTEYRGVACDADNNEIVALFMNQNNMEGLLPTEMGLLTSLVNMDFDLNLLRGSIPDSFKALTKLENFFASGNRMTGPIPSWIGSWTAMRNINLSHNLLTGKFPSSLGNLLAMEGLALDNNLLTNSLDGIFDSNLVSGFRNLEQFYLENNQFTGTLSQNFMKDMTKISYLDISDNMFSGSVPSHLFEYQEMVVLDLHDNDFSTLPSQFPANDKMGLLSLQKCKFANQAVPGTISNLKGLQHLDLSQNKFTGEIPSSIGSMKNLTYLFFAQNDFVAGPVPSWLEGLTLLEELDLKSTQLSAGIPDFLGTSLTNLILLDLDNNRLTGTIPESLGNLQDLHILLLNRNNLTSVIPTNFRNLQSLKLLFLEANTEISGSLGDTFCNNPAFVLKPVIVGNCDICDAVPDCCTLCCQKGEECNDGIHVPDLDPIWQLGYQRIFFTFRREDYFMKEQNGNINGNGSNGGRFLVIKEQAGN